MKVKVLFISMIVLAIGFAAISTTTKESADLRNDVVSVTQDDAATKYPKGAEIYNTKCLACHMATGEGIAGVFPPLKNSDYLMADKVRAAKQVLNGSNEAMVVNGTTYTMPMTPQVDTKEDAVAVTNYILNAWGNNGGTISVDDLKDVEIVR